MLAKYIIFILSLNYAFGEDDFHSNSHCHFDDEQHASDMTKVNIKLITDIVYCNVERKIDNKFDHLYKEFHKNMEEDHHHCHAESSHDHHEVKWIPTTAGEALSLTDCAVVAGYDGEGSPLWVIRANSHGDLLPGKLVAKHKTAYVPYGGNEYSVQDIEVCCTRPENVRWVESRDGAIPSKAIVAGNNNLDKEPLYVGRAKEQGFFIPGKVSAKQKGLFVSFAGKEIHHKIYEVLCLV